MHSKTNWNVSEAHVQELFITSDGDPSTSSIYIGTGE